MILLDTHVLLWWALDPDQLSDTAHRLLGSMERNGGAASSISIWELGIKIKRGKLEIGMRIDEFARRVQRTAAVDLVPVDTSIWLRSLELDWEHRDPADRVIAATALARQLPILTKDETIHRWGQVECIW